MTGPKKLLSAYIRSMGVPLVAANCCASVIDQQVNNFLITEKVFDEVVDKSIATKGMVFNRYLPANP
jgi:hypothetical protein